MLKRMGILCLLLAAFLMAGCVTFGDVQPCTVYEDVGATPENSLIAELIDDPCQAQDILATAAKMPLVWEQQEYAEAFEVWAIKVEAAVESGMSYEALQEFVVIKVAEFNQEAGLVLLILSDDILVFDGHGEMISEVDRKLLLMSLEDLRAQVRRMAVIAGI
mgnify:CR=1 FL=1